MNRKFRRDVSNLEEYYQSLEQEMRMGFCDQTHLLCPDCAARCPVCRKG